MLLLCPLQMTLLLKHTHDYRYDYELYVVISRVCRLYIQTKIKWFTQNMSILMTLLKGVKRSYVMMTESIKLSLLRIASVQSYFEIKVERHICCLLRQSMSLSMEKMNLLTVSKSSISMWIQSYLLSSWQTTFWEKVICHFSIDHGWVNCKGHTCVINIYQITSKSLIHC